MKRILFAYGALLCSFCLISNQAVAQSVLDQSATNAVNSGYSDINKGNSSVAQSFTAGITGSLDRVDLSIYEDLVYPVTGSPYTYNSPVDIKIYDSTFHLLGTDSVSAASIAVRSGALDLNNPFNFSANFTTVQIVTGSTYYIDIVPTTVVPSNFGGNGLFVGAGSNTYSGGIPVVFNVSNATPSASPFFAESNDILFKTFATPSSAIPEPASWAMMVGGFGLIGAALRRKKAAVSFA